MLRGPRVARSAGGALGGVAVSPGGVALGCDGIGPVAGPLGLRGVRFGFSDPDDMLSLGVVADGSFPEGPVIPPLLRDGRVGFSVLVELPFSPDGTEPAPLPLLPAFERSRWRSFFGVEDGSLPEPLCGVVPGPFAAGPLLFSRSRLPPSGVVFDGCVPSVAAPGRPFPVSGPLLLSRSRLPPSGVAFGDCVIPPLSAPGRPLPLPG